MIAWLTIARSVMFHALERAPIWRRSLRRPRFEPTSDTTSDASPMAAEHTFPLLRSPGRFRHAGPCQREASQLGAIDASPGQHLSIWCLARRLNGKRLKAGSLNALERGSDDQVRRDDLAGTFTRIVGHFPEQFQSREESNLAELDFDGRQRRIGEFA